MQDNPAQPSSHVTSQWELAGPSSMQSSQKNSEAKGHSGRSCELPLVRAQRGAYLRPILHHRDVLGILVIEPVPHDEF